MDPIQLISTGDSGAQLQINQEALNLISSEKRHITVVTVIGPYRTGKSYLLNRLMGNSDGFPLGATMEAKTKGFWLWKGDYPGDKSRCLILFDVEGLADVKKGNATHDLKMFTMALLLSTIFIYNTKGNIDASALDGLYLATKIADELMSVDAKKEKEEFARHFPHFIWAVRDHHLEMILNGKKVTPNEYLEHCLEPKYSVENSSSDEKDTENYNKLREAIRFFFPKRECFTFPPPVNDFDKMNHLETVHDDELYPPFKKAANEFVQFTLKNAKSKEIRGSDITGFAFAKLIENFLISVEMKKLSINATFDMVSNEENRKAVEIGIKKFREILSKMVFPVATSNFTNIVKNASETAKKDFLENCIDIQSNRSFEDQLNQQMKEIIDQQLDTNIKISSDKCWKYLNQLFSRIEKDMKEKYLVDGGFEALKQDVDKLKLAYQKQSESEEFGPCCNEVLQNFEREKLLPNLSLVMNADQKMSKMKQEEARLKMEKERLAYEKKRAEEDAAQQAKAAKAAKEASEINHKNMVDAMNSQHSQQMKQLRKQAENHEAEMKRMQADAHATQEMKNQMMKLMEDLKQEKLESERRHQEEIQQQHEREEENQRRIERELEKTREQMRIQHEQEKMQINKEADEGFFGNIGKVIMKVPGAILKGIKSFFSW